MYPQATPPPLPPRPPPEPQVRQQQQLGQNNEMLKTVQRIYEAADNYNPLNGVPFQINPIYNKQLNSDNESFV